MKPVILFEDASLIVIDKPAGMVVNRAETVKEETVQDWMDKRIKKQELRIENGERDASEKEFWNRSGMVHRLDKETSGVLLLAKTPAAFQHLKSQFQNRRIGKQYLALVHGRLEPKVGTIRLPLSRNPKNRRRFTVRLGGRPAETAYAVKEYRHKEAWEFTLVEVMPQTGRTHQIRVHFQFVKHPLVADPLYLSVKQLKRDRIWCSRLFLHAQKLVFSHPESGQRITVEAALPQDLSQALGLLAPIF
jgi:23S rRNA pseudouridine1911/1915/1917 synthase